MRLILSLIYFTSLFNSWSLEIIRDTIPANWDSTITGSLSVTEDFTADNASITGSLSVTENFIVDNGTFFVDASTNRVGIGLTSLSNALHVQKNQATPTAIRVQNGLANSASQAALYVNANGNNFSLINYPDADVSNANLTRFYSSASGGKFIFSPDNTDTLTVDGGAIGVGDTTPSYPIEAGTGPVAGNGAYVNTSDKRLKKNEESLTNACAIVDQLTPLFYDWKSVVPSSYSTWANGFQFYDEDGNLQDGENQVNKQKHGLKDVGFFAQDVESVFPQAVSTTSKGRYNLAYEKFIPLLVACIQEMRQQ